MIRLVCKQLSDVRIDKTGDRKTICIILLTTVPVTYSELKTSVKTSVIVGERLYCLEN